MGGSRVAGKAIAISGAGSGIGRAAAEALLAEGACVCLVDVHRKSLEVVMADLAGPERARAHIVAADVSVEQDVSEAIAACVTRFGKLDGVVANAGIEPGDDARAHELELDVWQRTIRVNLTGVFLFAKHGIRALLASGGGSVVCTASPTSLYGVAPGQDAYSASKAGVLGLAKVMAADYASDGIRVNAVVPGFTDTPMNGAVMQDPASRDAILATIPLRRAGTAAEVAGLIVYLASDEASYVTGATLCVDGGMTAV